jgi:hypothetical protein
MKKTKCRKSRNTVPLKYYYEKTHFNMSSPWNFTLLTVDNFHNSHAKVGDRSGTQYTDLTKSSLLVNFKSLFCKNENKSWMVETKYF